jgi:hypothetical protein
LAIPAYDGLICHIAIEYFFRSRSPSIQQRGNTKW